PADDAEIEQTGNGRKSTARAKKTGKAADASAIIKDVPQATGARGKGGKRRKA
ncbi:hypothetical protein FRC08_017794, partial [Ceratobasidium sp. 394]